jgi:hypothetical protein
MSASTNPFQLQGTLSYPPAQGSSPEPLPFGLSGSFTALTDTRLVMSGAGTTNVPFGTVVNAKLLLLEYEAAEGAVAVQLHINGSTEDLELTPGGMLLFASPTPVSGLTSLSVERTGDAVIRVRLLG